jgi:DNA repair protein RecN (Recombination protein N)
MLASLSIRDVVLIERLDLHFGPGLSVLTGETGAGKSILLDSLGLALGVRAEAGLVRAGQAQASVAAMFQPPEGHPAFAILAEQGLEAEDALVLRRVLQADGRSRAFVNDQPVGVALLKRLAATLVEVQGQHDQVGLADPATHAALLDAFGALDKPRGVATARFREWRASESALAAAEEAVAAALRDEEWLRHAVQELAGLAPEEGEEEAPGPGAPGPPAGRAPQRGDRFRAGRAAAAGPALGESRRRAAQCGARAGTPAAAQ